jgi:hypothetical protein
VTEAWVTRTHAEHGQMMTSERRFSALSSGFVEQHVFARKSAK